LIGEIGRTGFVMIPPPMSPIPPSMVVPGFVPGSPPPGGVDVVSVSTSVCSQSGVMPNCVEYTGASYERYVTSRLAASILNSATPASALRPFIAVCVRTFFALDVVRAFWSRSFAASSLYWATTGSTRPSWSALSTISSNRVVCALAALLDARMIAPSISSRTARPMVRGRREPQTAFARTVSDRASTELRMDVTTSPACLMKTAASNGGLGRLRAGRPDNRRDGTVSRAIRPPEWIS
jgi:hypothetical protein